MRFLALVTVALFSLISQVSEAATPNVHLKASYSSRSRSLSFTLTPDSSAEGCTYTIYGARSRARIQTSLTSRTSILSASGSSSVTTLKKSRLKTIKTARGKRNPQYISSYFRAVVSCGADSSMTNASAVRVLRKSSGLSSLKAWFLYLRAKFLVGSLSVKEAFPNVSFASPTDLQNAGDGTNRLFIAEQKGKIYVISNDPATSTKTLFLDISSKVENGGSEQGLLGIAFHPSYETNGFFYVHYSKLGTGDTVIARYSKSVSDPNAADPASELILLEQTQPFSNHNGGQITFGPDGYLYIGLGDGGSGGDPQGNGQNRATLLGKLLRIDVNNTENGKNYAIPSDNPFKGNGSGYKEEIFAYGFRNPWRFSFDPDSNLLFVADVGQDKYEEVDTVQIGKNYGWNTLEGTHCYQPSTGCDKTGLELPIAEYGHDLGESITGGFVYRGAKTPSLKGLYLYADFVTGRIWSLSGTTVTQLFDTDKNLSSFGIDENKELYILSYGDGKILTIG